MSKKSPKKQEEKEKSNLKQLIREYEDGYGNKVYLKANLLEELGKALKEFAVNSDGSDDFFKFIVHDWKISWGTFKYWVSSDKQLHRDFEDAKLVFGQKRQEMALKKVYAEGLSKFTLFHYLPHYKEIQKEINEVGGDANESKQKIVLIEKITDLEDNGNK